MRSVRFLSPYFALSVLLSSLLLTGLPAPSEAGCGCQKEPPPAAALFPNAAYPADFQTILAYGAGAVLEKIITTAQSLEAEKLKAAALQLNDKIVVATGQYHIEETGRQTKMEFSIMQNQKNGPEVIWPEPVRTAKAVYPVPKWSERKN